MAITTPPKGPKDPKSKPVQRRLIYDRNEPYKVLLQSCNDHGCGVFSYDATPLDEGADLKEIIPFRFFGFKDNIEPANTGLARQAANNLYCLAHMYVPPYFEEVGAQKKVTASNRFGIELDNVSQEEGFLGLFVLKLFGNKPNNSQPGCKKRGEFGCPTLLELPSDFSLIQTTGKKTNYKKAKGILGSFTFNQMSFYPFLMIDYTVCYFACDAGGSFDWNYRPDGTLKQRRNEFFPNVAIDAPVTYDATLGIYVTRSAHLVPDPIKGGK
ncbi:MAG TPA: hypothetical protein VK508_17965 [Cyclobacteriaceae bacterium]|nr:hypothetical protein [Cyclobacteriaceae bacterium]